ncbi:MAG TPA: helix-turn-helix domain-containing protein [Thermoanaerobaculia bacterium]|jgi:putative transcriptional regulator
MTRIRVQIIVMLAMVTAPDVKAIRYKLKQSQAEFAMMIGVSVATLQGWEDGRHRPDGPAQALLRVAAKNPKIVAKALGRA